ncbi:GGDEF domain-containing protein [Streptomyces xanthochromogenes]|uniref:GGDEF domain-containing protein n=1 Tax=Streptomyces xanthochromogenes TaxID=67384 RepID=UPI0034467EC7
MTSSPRLHAQLGTHRALFITTLALPLTGWTLHAAVLTRRLQAARRDPLTGLLGRDGYTARARQLINRHPGDALTLMVDLDDFKKINDGRGHAVGDRVLAVTAERLTTWAGSDSAVGRLGGDEFALTVRIAPAYQLLRLDHLVRLLAEPVTVPGEPAVDVAASIGAASPNRLQTRDLSLLQRAADAALYEGKHTRRAVLAGPQHVTVASANGRRAGRPGTGQWGRAA